MRKILCLLILLTAFYSEVAAYDFSAISYVTVENGVAVESSSGYFNCSLKLEKGNFGKGYLEDALWLKVALNDVTSIGGWFKADYKSKFMLCELTDAQNIKRQVVTLTGLNDTRRCAIFFPLSDYEMVIYLVNPSNINEWYTSIQVYASYKEIVNEIEKSIRVGAVSRANCNGYLDNLYLLPKQ